MVAKKKRKGSTALSEWLRGLRRERDMSRAQVAVILGVSKQAVSKWEKTKSIPEPDVFWEVCTVFDVSPPRRVVRALESAYAQRATAQDSHGESTIAREFSRKQWALLTESFKEVVQESKHLDERKSQIRAARDKFIQKSYSKCVSRTRQELKPVTVSCKNFGAVQICRIEKDGIPLRKPKDFSDKSPAYVYVCTDIIPMENRELLIPEGEGRPLPVEYYRLMVKDYDFSEVYGTVKLVFPIPDSEASFGFRIYSIELQNYSRVVDECHENPHGRKVSSHPLEIADYNRGNLVLVGGRFDVTESCMAPIYQCADMTRRIPSHSSVSDLWGELQELTRRESVRGEKGAKLFARISDIEKDLNFRCLLNSTFERISQDYERFVVASEREEAARVLSMVAAANASPEDGLKVCDSLKELHSGYENGRAPDNWLITYVSLLHAIKVNEVIREKRRPLDSLYELEAQTRMYDDLSGNADRVSGPRISMDDFRLLERYVFTEQVAVYDHLRATCNANMALEALKFSISRELLLVLTGACPPETDDEFTVDIRNSGALEISEIFEGLWEFCLRENHRLHKKIAREREGEVEARGCDSAHSSGAPV